MEPHWPSVTAGIVLGFILATVSEIFVMLSFFVMAKIFAAKDVEPD